MPQFEPMSMATAEQAEAAFQKALALHQQGRLSEARTAYQHVLHLAPGHAAALHLLGMIALAMNDPTTALDLFAESIRMDPGNAEVHVNCGSVYSMLKQYEVAIMHYERAIALDPESNAVPYFSRGAALLQLKRHEAAIASYDQAIALETDLDGDAYYGRAMALMGLKQHAAAIESFDKAIELGAHNLAEAHFNRGNVLATVNRWEAALESFERAPALEPDHLEALCNRGNVLSHLKQREAALASYERVLALKPDYAEILLNCGIVLTELDQWQAALARFDRAIELKPNYAEAFTSRGFVFAKLKQWDASLASYERAIALKPDYARAHYDRSMVWLSLGEYAKGWREHEWRWKKEPRTALEEPRQYPQPLWLGEESIAGKTILLYGEQGLGDTLQFCRYATLLAGLGASVILEVPPHLLRVLSSLPGVAQLLPTGSPLPSFDCHCPLMSLPLAFKTDLHSIPRANRYLASEASHVAKWKARLGRAGRARIGLTWSGSTIHKNDHNRSIALAALVRYLPEGLQYISLQKEIREADRRTLQANPHILNFADDLADFADTAALCECVDLVISVDTSVAHLSAALGRQTWILLPFVPDWRWLQDRPDSPWYPSVTLYRQETAADWNGVLERMRRNLSRLREV